MGFGVDELGAFSFLSVPWTPAGGAAPFFANFTCYTRALASFSLHFPGGYDFGVSSTSDAVASARFPLFYAAGVNSTLLSDDLGFIEFSGEMDSYKNKHGIGLRGYGGGIESGPLVLWNASELVRGASKPHALVLGPGGGSGTHVAHGVINLLDVSRTRQPRHGATAACAASGAWAPHSDEVGALSAPGFEGGIMVTPGQPAECCAKCAAAGLAVCDSWVFDTDGSAGGANCWPLLGILGSKQVGDRLLGVMFDIQCDAPTPSAAPTSSTPADGFEAGVANSTPTLCCALCGALQHSACVAWVFDEPSGSCFPLKAAAVSSTPAPGKTWAAMQVSPKWLAAGVQGEIERLPPRFTSKWLLSGSATGINDAMMAYGAALKDAAPGGGKKLQRELDPLRNLITYWSDNGAFYFDGYWPKFLNNATNTAQDVFLALKAYHASLGFTIGAYQLDPYWYGGACGSEGPPAPSCYVPDAWPWSTNWSAAPGFFPDGLQSLGLGLTLYSNLFAQPPLNKMTQFNWVSNTGVEGRHRRRRGGGHTHRSPSSTSSDPGWARVAANQSYDFHSYIFDAGITLGQNSFEIDFADVMFEGSQDFRTDVRAFDAYFEGMNTAAREHAFPVQLCMTLPAHTISSVAWDMVTNARLNSDGYVFVSRYDIFQTSLLYAAVGLSPFLDNVWTTGCQPAWDNPYGNATCEMHSEQLVAIATLSAGPIGFADRVGFTNATLLNMTCRSDGVLLQPDLPMTNLEFHYADALAPAVGAGARIASAPSWVPMGQAGSQRMLFLSVFSTFVSADVAVAPVDLWPALLPPAEGVQAFYLTALSRRSACVDGVDARRSGCATRFSGSAFDTLFTTNTGGNGHEVFSIAPVFTLDSWALLGELDKFTRVSGKRIGSITPGCSGSGGLCFDFLGAVGESVEIALVNPFGNVVIFSGSVGPAGVKKRGKKQRGW